MVKFDHMNLPVSDVRKSRDWYVSNLGFKVEFERGGIVAIQDSAGFTIFLRKASKRLVGDKVTLTIQLKSVDRTHDKLSKIGVSVREFTAAPVLGLWCGTSGPGRIYDQHLGPGDDASSNAREQARQLKGVPLKAARTSQRYSTQFPQET